MDTATKGRRKAASAGSRFYLAAPCPKGHDGIRYTRNGACVQCAKNAARAEHELVKRLLAGKE